MTKPTIVSRASLGRPLTYTELDTNFTNLRDAVFQVEGLNDDSTGGLFTVEQGGDFTLRGGSNVTIAVDSSNRIITVNSLGGDVVNDTTPQLGGDLDVNGQAIVSTSNADINIVPNGTGNVNLSTDTVRVGENIGLSGFNVIESYPDSRLLLRSYDTSSNGSTMYFTPGSSSNIILGASLYVSLSTPKVVFGDGAANSEITSSGAFDLTLTTNSGTNSGSVKINDGVNGDIEITANGTGKIVLAGALKTNTTSGTPTTYQNGYYEGMLVTPATWLKINVGGTDYYLPLFT